jgi:quinol monooxygenase YgiN
MGTFDTAVSIHPYFKIQKGQMQACKDFLRQFTGRVVSEEKCLYYNFTLNGDWLCCREAYRDADGVQAHLENCGALLGELLKIAELTRIEIHGPAAELDKLKETFAEMNPDYFICECGIGR